MPPPRNRCGGDSELGSDLDYCVRDTCSLKPDADLVIRRKNQDLTPSMIRPILRFGAGVLHEPAARVPEITAEVLQLVDDMIQTMYAAPGVGLAATQVGVPLRVFVADVSLGRDPNGLFTFVNPEFVERDGMQLEEEGCLSVPGFNATVARPTKVILKGLDRNGLEQVVEGTDLLARCFQHEMDHLDGKLFVDRLRGLQKDLIVRKIRKLSRAGKW